MQITRTEQPTGGENRTRRETIVPLNTGPRKAEPELYVDVSESEGWPWKSDPNTCTWDIQIAAVRGFIAPFEELDSQAKEEQASGSDEMGGVYAYPFSNVFLPMGQGEDDGDLNSSNFTRKLGDFDRTFFDGTGRPQRGGTMIMAAVQAGDKHFMGEFSKDDRADRPVRARVVFTDGAITDAKEFRAYLSQATLDTQSGYGQHGEWDEVWAIAILGETGDENGGKAAYQQYLTLAKDHPWIHPYYFENVVNPAEIAEDMAVAVVPTNA